MPAILPDTRDDYVLLKYRVAAECVAPGAENMHPRRPDHVEEGAPKPAEYGPDAKLRGVMNTKLPVAEATRRRPPPNETNGPLL